MIKVGLIGYGNWGKIIYEKIKFFCDVKFICRSKDDYKPKLKVVDWLVIATPDQTHFNIVRDCIFAGKNVFCEKPLTLTRQQSEILFDYAKEHDVRLYVDDVQNFRKVRLMLKERNLVERKKKDKFNHADFEAKDLIYRLAYHDVYFLYEFIKQSRIEKIIPIDVKNKLHFKVKFKDMDIEFDYDTNYENERIHKINGNSLMGDGKDDPLEVMLVKVLNENVDFEYNKELSLFTNGFLDELNKNLF